MGSEAVTFEYPDGTYVREGECNRCGECCVGDPFSGAEGDPTVPGYCPLFRWITPESGHCTDRKHPYYLNGCNTFPSHPGQIADKPSCSYSFRKVA